MCVYRLNKTDKQIKLKVRSHQMTINLIKDSAKLCIYDGSLIEFLVQSDVESMKRLLQNEEYLSSKEKAFEILREADRQNFITESIRKKFIEDIVKLEWFVRTHAELDLCTLNSELKELHISKVIYKARKNERYTIYYTDENWNPYNKDAELIKDKGYKCYLINGSTLDLIPRWDLDD